MTTALQSRGRAATAHAARYMTQLAKHWSHKYETDFDKTQARIVIPQLGVCRMAAGPDALEVTLEAADPETLSRFQGVFDRHLARFAFREPELTVAWP